MNGLLHSKILVMSGKMLLVTVQQIKILILIISSLKELNESSPRLCINETYFGFLYMPAVFKELSTYGSIMKGTLWFSINYVISTWIIFTSVYFTNWTVWIFIKKTIMDVWSLLLRMWSYVNECVLSTDESYYKSSSVCLFVCLFPISSEVLWPIFAKLGGCM